MDESKTMQPTDPKPLEREHPPVFWEPARRTRRPARRAGLAPRSRRLPCAEPARPARAVLVAPSTPARSEVIAGRVLLAIRGAIGVLFLACGVRGVVGLAPAQVADMQHGAIAFGGALMLAGSLLPLLKGTEVLIELVLDLQRSLGARQADER